METVCVQNSVTYSLISNMTRNLVLCFVVIAVSTGFVHSNPAKPAFWKGTPVDELVENMRSLCNEENDSFSCMKFKVMNFLDTILKKDNYMITDDVEVRHNGYAPVNEQRSEKDILEKVEDYVQSHDVTVNVPAVGAKVTLSPKTLNEDEINFNVKFTNGARSSVEGEFFSSKSKQQSKVFFFHSSQVKVEEALRSTLRLRSS